MTLLGGLGTREGLLASYFGSFRRIIIFFSISILTLIAPYLKYHRKEEEEEEEVAIKNEEENEKEKEKFVVVKDNKGLIINLTHRFEISGKNLRFSFTFLLSSIKSLCLSLSSKLLLLDDTLESYSDEPYEEVE